MHFKLTHKHLHACTHTCTHHTDKHPPTITQVDNEKNKGKMAVFAHTCICTSVINNFRIFVNVNNHVQITPFLCIPLKYFPSIFVINSCPGYLAGVFQLKLATRLIALQLQLQIFFFPKFGLSLGQIWVRKILGKSFEMVFGSIYQEHIQKLRLLSLTTLLNQLTFQNSLSCCDFSLHFVCEVYVELVTDIFPFEPQGPP